MKYLFNGKEMTAREIKVLSPNISYKEPTQLGAVAILPTPKPTCTDLQQAIRDGVATDPLGNVVEVWKVVDKFTDVTRTITDEEGNEVEVLVTRDEVELEYLTSLQEATTAKEKEEHNNAIYKQLDELDIKSIRPIRSNETERIQEIEEEVANLRAKLL